MNSTRTHSIRFLFLLVLLPYLTVPGILLKSFSRDLCGASREFPPYYVLDSHDSSGNPMELFVGFNMVIGFLDYCDRNENAGFHVNFTDGMYLNPKMGPNWWEYFFEPIEEGVRAYAQPTHFENPIKGRWFCDALFSISRERAQALIEKHIKVRPPVQQKIDSFVDLHFKDHFVIGIHYHGTDKNTEAPKVPYEAVYDEVQSIISGLDSAPYKIFVATDEQNFVDQISNRFGNNVIYQDVQRFCNDKPLPHDEGKQMSNPVQQGEEALRDCILLSKCNILVRTASNLSSTAGSFNAQLDIRDLSKLYDSHLKKYNALPKK